MEASALSDDTGLKMAKIGQDVERGQRVLEEWDNRQRQRFQYCKSILAGFQINKYSRHLTWLYPQAPRLLVVPLSTSLS